MAGESLPKIEFENADALDDWLAANHSTAGSIWAVLWKKQSPQKYIDRETLLKTVLRYGWVDSLPRKLDADRSMLMLSPRKAGSAWSAVNKRIITQLESADQMHPSGQAAVQRAKEDGSWTVLDGADKGIIPSDLVEALGTYPGARENFYAFPLSAKRGILEWIAIAKKAETRNKRVEETARLAAENKRALDCRAKNKR
ncbi:MAG: YdeI/OmpD-associated family protein [Pseudomonadota bacterium]